MRKSNGFRWKALSQRQKQVLSWWTPQSAYSSYNGIIADGAIRSGKTFAMSFSFVQWAMTCYSGQQFAMCGKTISSFRRNVLGTLKQQLAARSYNVKEHRAENCMTVSKGGRTNEFYFFGGKDESSQDLIQGITLAGAFFDEVALMPQSFVNQATARCSVTGSKFWFNCNPGSPQHWGSPPRVRGKVEVQVADKLVAGITPACAGKSGKTDWTTMCRRDHPRVCGEKVIIITVMLYEPGSPPRVRGKVLSACERRDGVRITPACAGKSPCACQYAASQWDHPRVCGEKCIS